MHLQRISANSAGHDQLHALQVLQLQVSMHLAGCVTRLQAHLAEADNASTAKKTAFVSARLNFCMEADRPARAKRTSSASVAAEN
jgi:hypothetical protein